MIEIVSRATSAITAATRPFFAFLAATLVLGTATSALAQDKSPSDPIRETHGAWDVRCAESGGCYISQVWNNDEGQPVLLVSIRKLSNPTSSGNATIVAQGNIVTPLDVFLPAALGMQIDSAAPQLAPFIRCLPIGCIAQPPISEELIEAFKKGSTATFLLRRQPQSAPVEAPISLSGFTKAYGAL